jgi:hypothetical protein
MIFDFCVICYGLMRYILQYNIPFYSLKLFVVLLKSLVHVVAFLAALGFRHRVALLTGR